MPRKFGRAAYGYQITSGHVLEVTICFFLAVVLVCLFLQEWGYIGKTWSEIGYVHDKVASIDGGNRSYRLYIRRQTDNAIIEGRIDKELFDEVKPEVLYQFTLRGQWVVRADKQTP